MAQKNFVKNAFVSVSITGVLKILITQRLAIARVFDKNNKSYYLDSEGFVLKTEANKVADVLIASGDITDTVIKKMDTVKNKQIFDIYNLSVLINSDSILKYQIDQIVRQENSYILMPKIGNYEILLGKKDRWKDELFKLRLLYKKAFVKGGWNDYSQIDLRFNNQVICTRK